MMSIAALSQFEYAAAENAASQALRLVSDASTATPTSPPP